MGTERQRVNRHVSNSVLSLGTASLGRHPHVNQASCDLPAHFPLAERPLSAVAGAMWDVLVIGAGPAGALAARQAALRGARVLLVDRCSFPRGKVCGACLGGGALGVLERVGLGELPARAGARPLGLVRLVCGRRTASLPLHGAVLSRRRLDAALVAAAIDAGASFLPDTSGEVGPCAGPARQVVLRRGREQATLAARFVLAADGLAGRAGRSEPRLVPRVEHAARIGAQAVVANSGEFVDEGALLMACGRQGYVGAVRLEDGRLNVATALDPAAVKREGGVGQAVERILAETGWRGAPLAAARWHGTPALTRRVVRPALDRLLVVGDAAGYVEPFTGEGIGWALASGAAAARLVVESLQSGRRDVDAAWTRLHRQMLGRRQSACRLVTLALRSPALVHSALLALAHLPGLAAPLLRQLETAPGDSPW